MLPNISNSQTQIPAIGPAQAGFDQAEITATQAERASLMVQPALDKFLPGPHQKSLAELVQTRITRPLEAIHAEQILVVTKASKVELDCQRYRMTTNELREFYNQQGADTDRIFDSHYRQQTALTDLIERLPAGRVINRTQLAAMQEAGTFDDFLSTTKAVISLGGDNHFQWVAEQMRSQSDLKLIGMNSDPQTSHGKLLQVSAKDLDPMLKALESGDYQVQEWARLKVKVGSGPEIAAISEIFIGERERTQMSRNHVLIYDAQDQLIYSYEDKSSGMIIATGCGASGWIRAAGAQLGDLIQIERGSDLAMILSTEIFSSAPQNESEGPSPLLPMTAKEFVIPRGAKLVIESLNDSEGIVSCDSQPTVSFPRISSKSNKAVIRFDTTGLKVLIPEITSRKDSSQDLIN